MRGSGLGAVADMFAAGEGADPDIEEVECEHAAASTDATTSSVDCRRARNTNAMTNFSLDRDVWAMNDFE